MILYLNKRDLFGEKIKQKNIRDFPAFSDYAGECQWVVFYFELTAIL